MDKSKLLMTTGVLLIIFAAILKLGGAPCRVGIIDIRLLGIVVLANTFLLLAILVKK